MLLSSTVVLLSALVVQALPSGKFASVLTNHHSALRDLPVGKTPISRDDMKELGRLAAAVNAAYCPKDKHLEPQLPAQLPFQSGRHQRRSYDLWHTSSILISSNDPEFQRQTQDLDMNWYISHTPSTQTLTLALSSLPDVEDLLEFLSANPANSTDYDEDDGHLAFLPSYLFPAEHQPHLIPPRIHHTYLPALESHGTSALLALLDLIESPPVPTRTGSDVFQSLLKPFKQLSIPPPPKPIRHVEIIGHGLGSAVGLLVATALNLEVSGPAATTYENPLPVVDISATLFGLPRVGDHSFANWIDSLVKASSRKLRINRVTSYSDTIAHLPERHLELSHPSIGEIWIGADPRVGYACRSADANEESDVCAGSIPISKTSLLDHAGPFGGVWIGSNSCRRPKADETAL